MSQTNNQQHTVTTVSYILYIQFEK